MKKFELTIVPNYLEDWTLTDGIRELFQNALDQKNLNKSSDIYFNYEPESQTLVIGNTNAKLEIQSLLLGSSTKQNNIDAIGKFGEGYKVAALVLLRLGKKVKFHNNMVKELWEPRFVKSRTYKTNILTFFVSKTESNGRDDLMVEVTGITPEEYEQVIATNLHLQEPEEVITTDYGCILKGERNRGKVFVNGLFVCDHEKYKFGYDFKPQFISLGRDRKLVSDWDLQWISSKMWKACDAKNEDLKQLIKDQAADVAFYDRVENYYGSGYNNDKEVAEIVYNEFKAEHGELAVPVSSHEEMKKVSEKYTPVIVNELYKNIILKAKSYDKQDAIVPEESVVVKFENLLESVKGKLNKQEVLRFKNCIDKLKEVASRFGI